MTDQSQTVSMECPICYGNYSEVSPTTLPCGHSCCLDDALKLKETNRKCPICQHTFTKHHKFALNYSLRDCVKLLTAQKQVEMKSVETFIDFQKEESLNFESLSVGSYTQAQRPNLDGFIKYTGRDRLTYEGCFKGNAFNGPGKLTKSDATLEGNFADGLLHGKGKITSILGIYEGEFKNGLRHGKGSVFLDGELKKGNFILDKLDPQKVQIFDYNLEYEGYDYSCEEVCFGSSLLTDDNTNKVAQYCGEWHRKTYHGFGRLTTVGLDFVEYAEYCHGKVINNSMTVEVSNNGDKSYWMIQDNNQTS